MQVDTVANGDGGGRSGDVAAVVVELLAEEVIVEVGGGGKDVDSALLEGEEEVSAVACRRALAGRNRFGTTGKLDLVGVKQEV